MEGQFVGVGGGGRYIGELCKTLWSVHSAKTICLGAARLHILAQFDLLSWRPLGDMEHCIVGLFLCNVYLFVLRIAWYSRAFCAAQWAHHVMFALIFYFLCKRGNNLQKNSVTHCMRFLRSVFLHNFLTDTSPCARVVSQLFGTGLSALACTRV